MKVDDRIVHVKHIGRLPAKNGEKVRRWLRRCCRGACARLSLALRRHTAREDNEGLIPKHRTCAEFPSTRRYIRVFHRSPRDFRNRSELVCFILGDARFENTNLARVAIRCLFYHAGS